MLRNRARNWKGLWRHLKVLFKCLHNPYFCFVLLFVGLLYFGYFKNLSHVTAKEILFYIREELGFSPTLSQKIKIFAIDDKTYAYLNFSQPHAEDWVASLKALTKRNPKAILLDKLFDAKVENDFVPEKLANVYHGIFLTQTQIKGRKQLGFKARENGVVEPITTLKFVYGSQSLLTKSFEGVGQVILLPAGEVYPFVHSEEGQAYYHLGLKGQEISVQDKRFLVNGFPVPLDEKGAVVVNLPSPSVIQKKTYSLLPVISRARKGAGIPIVNEGDVVIILPAMYTGNSDWYESPLGTLPGGYYLVSVVNSALTGDWIRVVEASLLMLVLMSALWVFVLKRVFKTPMRSIFALVLPFFIVVLSSFLFIKYDIIIYFIEPLFFFLGLSVINLHKRIYEGYTKDLLIENRMKEAEQYQISLLGTLPSVPELEMKGFYSAAEQLGGDWYRVYFDAENGQVYFLIADVVGHGINSAIATGVISGCTEVWFTYKKSEGNPNSLRQLFEEINTSLAATQPGIMCTMCALCYELDSSALYFLSAGHPFPLVLSSSGKMSSLKANGSHLGAAGFEASRVKRQIVEKGTLIFLYTDGILENKGLKNTFLKKRELCHILKGKSSVEDIYSDLLEKGKKTFLRHQDDDVSFLLIKL